MTKEELQAQYNNCDAALNDINFLMWSTFMVKGYEFGRDDGAKIMAILNEWCRKEEEIAKAVGVEEAGDESQP